MPRHSVLCHKGVSDADWHKQSARSVKTPKTPISVGLKCRPITTVLLILWLALGLSPLAVTASDSQRSDNASAHTNLCDSRNAPTDFYNPPLNLHAEQLRILDIGNSFTQDAVHHLPEIIDAFGLDASDMCLYVAYSGGASFKKWVDIFNDKSGGTYDVYKAAGNLDAVISGETAPYNGEKFRNTLTDNIWDLIIIHQLSNHSPYYDKWTGEGDAGCLDDLLSIIREKQPHASVGFLLVHSAQGSHQSNIEHSTLDRWQLIAQSAKRIQEDYNMDVVIPYGTAIESLRATIYNNAYDLTEDGLHLSSGLADYTAACTYYQTLLAPRYGVSILGNTARIKSQDSHAVDVDDDNAYAAQLCAIEAVKNYTSLLSLVIPEKIDLQDNLTMAIGDSMDLSSFVLPTNATDRSLKVISDDESVVKVGPDGVITAVCAGESLITASTYNGISTRCAIKVEGSNASCVDMPGDSVQDESYYDLLGRCCQNPTSGVYVHKGKLCFIK